MKKRRFFSLAERGGTPPPLTESPLSFSGDFFPKRAKNDEGHIMVQKGLKMHKKRQKIEFLDLKRRFFSLAEKGGTPPPLTDEFR